MGRAGKGSRRGKEEEERKNVPAGVQRALSPMARQPLPKGHPAELAILS